MNVLNVKLDMLVLLHPYHLLPVNMELIHKLVRQIALHVQAAINVQLQILLLNPVHQEVIVVENQAIVPPVQLDITALILIKQ